MNLGLGLRLRSVLSSSEAAPSGIPVASTSQIIVASTNSLIFSGPFDKLSPLSFASTITEDNVLDYFGGAWYFYNVGSQVAFATSPASHIPTSGYTIIDGGGSFTITAA